MLEVPSSAKPNATARALLAGFVASTAMIYLFAAGFWVAIESPRYLGLGLSTFAGWERSLVYNLLVVRVESMISVALIFHFLLGMGWAVLYGVFVEPHLRGSAWRKGMVFSLIPWVLSLVVFFPLMGAQLFGMGLGAGPLPALGNLILHLCYGVILGVTYGPLGDAVTMSDATPQDVRIEQQAMALSTQRAAKGLVIGVLLGSLVGTSLYGSASASISTTYSPEFVMLTGIMLGGGLGCLIGAFAGLPTGARGKASHHV